MAEQDLDRSQQATPHKLQKAKERGQVAKSRDVVSASVFTVAMVYISWQGWRLLREQFLFDRALLLQAARLDASPDNLWNLVERMITNTLWLGLPMLSALMITAVLANLFQTGAVLSLDPLKVDLTRLNPLYGVKNFFSIQVLFNGVRTILKLVFLTGAVWLVLRSLAAQFYFIAGLTPLGFVRQLLEDFTVLGLKLALVLWIIALVDLRFTKNEFAKKMKMSFKELTDEVKQREGDPRLRARLRDLRREMRKRSTSVRNTRSADVVITNPTHVAVALRYQHGQMPSPQLVAKGAGVLAAAMRAIAARHNIPVVQNPALARALFRQLDVNRAVPPEFFSEVARIIVWVIAMRPVSGPAATAGGRQ